MQNEEQPNEIEQVEQTQPKAGGGAEPTTSEVQSLYDELGIEAKAPTTKGRPKSSGVRAKNVQSKDNGDSESKGQKTDKSDSQSKDAPDNGEDGVAGDEANSKSQKKRQDDGEISEKSGEAGDGVRKDKSESEGDSKRGSEESLDGGDSGAGQEEHDQSDSEEEEREAGKRPGKSNPEVEKRFQRLTSDVRQRDEEISRLRQELEQSTTLYQQQKMQEDDPEYTIDDFRKVRDGQGNILDLDDNEAELAWRRWKDGYDQRGAEREARFHQQRAQEAHARETEERLMRSSVEAYDTLVSIMDEYPALNPKSPSFDQSFSDEVMPIIEDSVIYQPGTEPGNEEGLPPTIVGMKINPNTILKAMNRIQAAKRAVPLNGLDDNVESPSNINVPHSRSSDPMVNAANELYNELGIKKRV